MKAINTGGPAFPSECGNDYKNEGMTLRDYFAANAMIGILASGNNMIDEYNIALKSYRIAKEMLLARELQ